MLLKFDDDKSHILIIFFSKFQAPEKKPLVRRDPVEDVHAKVRKGSQNMLPDPIEDLQEFHDRHFQDLETI